MASSLNALACQLSARFSALIASPLALPVYIVARFVMWATLPEGEVTVILSDFANVTLLLLAVEQARQANKVEKGVEELARANPDIDDSVLDQT